jgi:hypothetical protein
VFVQRPISAAFLACTVALLLWAAWSLMRGRGPVAGVAGDGKAGAAAASAP